MEGKPDAVVSPEEAVGLSGELESMVVTAGELAPSEEVNFSGELDSMVVLEVVGSAWSPVCLALDLSAEEVFSWGELDSMAVPLVDLA